MSFLESLKEVEPPNSAVLWGLDWREEIIPRLTIEEEHTWEEGSAEVEVLSVGGEQGRTGEAGEHDAGQHEGRGHQGRVHHDGHVEEGTHAQTGQEREPEQHTQARGSKHIMDR